MHVCRCVGTQHVGMSACRCTYMWRLILKSSSIALLPYSMRSRIAQTDPELTKAAGFTSLLPPGIPCLRVLPCEVGITGSCPTYLVFIWALGIPTPVLTLGRT